MSENPVMVTDTIERQRNYVEQQKQKGHGLGVVFADAFLRGMRDLGYKSPAWALAEQLDNSFQAGADNVAVRFHFDSANKGKAKPDQIAICDNGNGMIPEMIGFAVRWGGTDREGDRKGLGRYGYGLPSSAVSIAKRYTVYSKTANTDWHAVTVDIDDLAAAAGDIGKTEEMLTAKPAKLPKWLRDAKDDGGPDLSSLNSGTVIVFEEMDRLRRTAGWITAGSLKTKLLQHFGVIYRHFIPERKIVVDGVIAQAVDPLFLMEHGRFYRETSVPAQGVDARTIEVETSRGTKGKVSMRASVLPPNFQSADPKKFGPGSKTNSRFDIMREYNGLLICRGKRQIDCILPRFTKFQNYDANIKIEIDFDPELDEFFGMTTAKQQIVIDDEMWEKLQHDGKGGAALIALVRDLRDDFERQQTELKAKVENVAADEEEQRASVQAMEESEKFKGSTTEPTTEQKEEAKRNLEEAAEKRSEVTGEPKEEVIDKLVKETTKRRWEVEFAAIPEGPFYRPVRLGEQKRLVINTDHPFYTRIYTAAPEVRAALEVMLFVLAERELDVKNDAETFYKAERQRWSERLRHALDMLVPDDAMVDKANAMAEILHTGEAMARAAE